MTTAARDSVYRIAFDVAASGLGLASTKGVLLRVNDAFCDILGYGSASDLVGKTFRDVVHRDDVDSAAAALSELLDGERQSYRTERRYQRRDGSVVWMLVSVALVRDQRSHPWYFVVQIQDLTAYKERDELARRAALVKNHHSTADVLQSSVLSRLRAAQRQLADGDAEAARETIDLTVIHAEQLLGTLLDEERVRSSGGGSGVPWEP